MNATPLESAIFAWLGERHPRLAARLQQAEIASREHTGAGLYVHLAPSEASAWDRPPLSGPAIESPQLEFGGGCILWLSHGEPTCLEIYAFGNVFPAALDDFTLGDADAPA